MRPERSLGLFSHEGEDNSVPERNVLPKPPQKPHPPLWVTATNPDTVERAGRMGLGVEVFSFQSPQALEPLAEDYKKAIADPDPISEVVNEKFLTIAPLLCLEDGDRARDWHARRANLTTAHFSVYFDPEPYIATRLADEPRLIRRGAPGIELGSNFRMNVFGQSERHENEAPRKHGREGHEAIE